MMLGTLEVKESDNPEAFVRALVDAKYVTDEELKRGRIDNQLVANVLYRIFKDTHPYRHTVKLADTYDPALLWAVEKGIPGFIKDKENKVHPDHGYFASEYQQAIAYCTYLFQFADTGDGKPGWQRFTMKKAEELQDTHNLLHRQLLVNGIQYELAVQSKPDLEQDPVFLAAREQAKNQLVKETEAALIKWIEKQRQKVLAR